MQETNRTGSAHWMLREIHEQPAALAATMAHFVADSSFLVDSCAPALSWLGERCSKLVIAASGSSRHAGLFGEILIEDLSGIAVDVEYASEYCCRSEAAMVDAGVIVISQSGETADTLAALRKANAAGHPTLAITNVDDSTISSEATVSFATHAGRERAIPATKSFTCQLLNLYLAALMAAASRNRLTAPQLRIRLSELGDLPSLLGEHLLGWDDAVRDIASQYSGASSFLFLGRGIHYAIAREGALKLKESAYLHAEGYPSGELKHGPNALVSSSTPLVMLATVDHTEPESVVRYEKIVHLMRDMRAQHANIFAVANLGDTTVQGLANHTLFVPQLREPLLAMAEVIPLQLFSYWMAVGRGIDVDHPRNLTKAVLSE